MSPDMTIIINKGDYNQRYKQNYSRNLYLTLKNNNMKKVLISSLMFACLVMVGYAQKSISVPVL